MPFRKLLSLLYLSIISLCANAQLYPVQATTQLIPPYSVYLSDYATAGTEQLRVILVQRDLTVPSYQLRLVMTVELNGSVILRTSRTFAPPPITLSPGVPTIISGADLAPYVDSRNMDFIGYSRNEYDRTKALPEGSYQITFMAYDYHRQDVQVSNPGSSFYYLSKNEPPLINTPACGTNIPSRTPQQIIFTWLPRNTASPNSAGDTQYEFALYETRPISRNPNDVVLTTNPVFKTTVDQPQLVYGPAEPMLLDSMKYVWRVRAIDINGKDAFRNNGYSEVCTFTYGGRDPNFIVGGVKTLNAEGETERRARIWWTPGDFDGYRIFYHKTGGDYAWFTNDIAKNKLSLDDKGNGELKVFDLEANTEYETRIQCRKQGVWGDYSPIVKFKTTPQRVVACGDESKSGLAENGRPLLTASTGMNVQVEDIEMTLGQINNLGNGYYQGTGRVSIAYLGGASFGVKFDRLFINENRTAGTGRIDFISRGVAAMIEEQITAQHDREQKKIQDHNRDVWSGTDFYDKIFKYDDIDIDSITVGGSSVVNIIDVNGNVTANAEVMQVINTIPNKAIIIQDKSGDQFVVQKEKETGTVKVTKVAGGGLGAGGNDVTPESVNILKQALALIAKDYNTDIVQSLQKDFNNQKANYEDHRSAVEKSFVAVIVVSNDDFKGERAILLPATSLDMTGKDLTDDIVTAYKSAEMNYYSAVILAKLSSNDLTVNDAQLLSSKLIVGNLSIGQYLERHKSDQSDDQIETVKRAIVTLIQKTLHENY